MFFLPPPPFLNSTCSPSDMILIQSVCIRLRSSPRPLTPRRVMYCSSIFTAADMNNGTTAPVLLEGAPQQFAMIVLKLPGWENHLFCLML